MGNEQSIRKQPRRQRVHHRKFGERLVGFRFVTTSFCEYNREFKEVAA
jgi:hypothetical protein